MLISFLTSFLVLPHVVVREPLPVLGHQWTVKLLAEQQLQVPVGTLGILHTLKDVCVCERRRGRVKEKGSAVWVNILVTLLL